MARGGDKTEQPTWKRLREAKRQGQTAKSRDLTSALLFTAAIATLGIAGRQTALQLSAAFRAAILRAATFQGELDQTAAVAFLSAGAVELIRALVPLFIVLMVIAIVGNYLQVGSIFAFQALTPNLNRLNPVENLNQKLFQSRPYLELLKTILKIVIAATIIGAVLWSARVDLIRLTSQPVSRAAIFISALIFEIGLKVGLSFLALGVADLFLQKFLHLKNLKMSKQEVKDDYKETQGNPLYKQLRKRQHREILQGAISDVKNANVVVANPTHVAVALKYERALMGAPVVIAKGAELLAARIRQIAEEARVPVATDPPLARALFELEIDEEIPEELYEAVAEVLRWVYRLAQERGEV